MLITIYGMIYTTNSTTSTLSLRKQAELRKVEGGPKIYIFLTLPSSEQAAQSSHEKRGKHGNGMKTLLLH